MATVLAFLLFTGKVVLALIAIYLVATVVFEGLYRLLSKMMRS